MDDKNIILVVEDELPLVEAISKKLALCGFEVVTARTVPQAIDYLESVDGIKAVWLDHYLIGQGNGLDLVAKIKEEGSAWSRIPIFVVSNTASGDKMNSYLELGVEKFYTKSDFRLDQIIDNIKESLAKQEKTRNI